MRRLLVGFAIPLLSAQNFGPDPPSGSDGSSLLFQMAAGLALTMIILGGGLYIFRRLFRGMRNEYAEAQNLPAIGKAAAGGVSPDSAFVMATFQGVIRQMKEQEAELERLHRWERQRAEESQQLTQTIMKSMATGLVLLNARGMITEGNPAAKQVLGHQILAGRGYREVFFPAYDEDSEEPPPEGLMLLEDCLQTGATTRRLQMQYQAPKGQTMVLGLGFSPIRGADGEVAGAICLLTDLTEINSLQNEIRLKEHMAALGEMAAGIAHEFKNSLATISGYAQMIQGASSEEASAFASRILKETQTLATIVGDFLNFSRPLSIQPVAVGARDLVESSWEEIVARGRFPNVRLEMRGDFPTIQADATLMRQAFSNLLRNSCESMDGDGGLITVETEIEFGEQGPMVRISFGDNAGGISTENQEKVFIPFFTTKAAGTGLGLPLVHKIVVDHNGKIAFDSAPGHGTTFHIRLPLA